MKAVVVYYSRFGHTAKVAEMLAQELGVEVRRIEETKQRAREFARKVKGAGV